MNPLQRWPAARAPLLAVVLTAPALIDVLGASSSGLYVGNGTDLYSYQYPLRATAAAMVSQGQAPWWNPYVLGGVPSLAGWQLGLLYPPHLLQLLAPWAATEAMLWLHLAWLAAGSAWLAQRWRPGLPAWAAVTAAGAAALGGQTWGHIYAGHVSWIEALAWAPWLWGALVGWMERRRPRDLAWASAALALQLLAGHPQLSYLTLVGAAVLLLARSVGDRRPPAAGAALERWPLAAVAALGLLLAGAAAGLLTAAQLGPTAALTPHLNRALSTPLEIATSYSAPPVTLWTSWAPAALGGASTKLTAFAYHETLAFLGPAMIALVLSGAAVAGRRGAVLLAAATLATLVSLGEHGPLLPALVDWLPGLTAFRVPGRWMVLPMLWAVPLAAEALGAALQGPAKRWPWWGAALAGAVSLYGLATLAGPQGWLAQAAAQGAPAARELAAKSAETGLLLGVVAAGIAAAMALVPAQRQKLAAALGLWAVLQGLWFAQQHLGPEKRMAEARIHWSKADAEALRQKLGPHQRVATAASLRQANWGGAWGIAGAGGYEPAITAATNRYGNLIAGRKPEAYAVLFQVRGPSAAVDRMAVSHALMAPGDAQANRTFAAWPADGTLPSGQLLRRNPTPRARAEWLSQPRFAATPQEATELVANDLANDSAVITGPSAPTIASTGQVQIKAEAPGEIHMHSISSGPGWVVLRDAWAPGWEVSVDGAQAPAQIADGLMRTVAVAGGDHRIEWRYTPQTWPWTPALSALSWLALLALLWRTRRSDPREIQGVDKGN